MNNVISINALSEGDFPDLLMLADKLFGKDYLSSSELQSYLDDPNKTALVASTDDAIAGFQLMQTCDLDEMMSLALCEPGWFQEQFSNHLPIGVLKTVAVSDEFKKRGIGTALTIESIEMLGKTSSCIISVCWDHKEGTPITGILEKCGMNLKHRIAEFWRADSLKKNYQCQRCGSPPCRCDGLIYQYMVSQDS